MMAVTRLDENGNEIPCECYCKDSQDEEGRLLCGQCFNVATQIVLRDGRRFWRACKFHLLKPPAPGEYWQLQQDCLQDEDVVLTHHEWIVWSAHES